MFNVHLAEQIAGADSDERKELVYSGFSDGSVRILITKPKIGAWGMNWQHCAHVVTFASHSYEQYYQSIRRCWRFGQRSPVTVDIVTTGGEARCLRTFSGKRATPTACFAHSLRTCKRRRDCLPQANQL